MENQKKGKSVKVLIKDTLYVSSGILIILFIVSFIFTYEAENLGKEGLIYVLLDSFLSIFINLGSLVVGKNVNMLLNYFVGYFIIEVIICCLILIIDLVLVNSKKRH